MLHAVGGSTNAIIHLAAIAGRAGVPLPAGRPGPPRPGHPGAGRRGTVRHPAAAGPGPGGGVPALLRELGGRLDTGAVTVTGATIGEIAAPLRRRPARSARPGFRWGKKGPLPWCAAPLAPDGAVIKTSAATAALLRHRGPALVFRGYEEMRRRVEDPALAGDPGQRAGAGRLRPGRGAGDAGVGHDPDPGQAGHGGVTDMVRVTDARMSGTSFGTVFLHAAPEAAVGGPLALVRDGDPVAVDVAAGLAHPGRARGRAGPAPGRPGRRRPRRTCAAGPRCTATTCCRHPRVATWTSCGPRRRSTAGSWNPSSDGPERTGRRPRALR